MNSILATHWQSKTDVKPMVRAKLTWRFADRLANCELCFSKCKYFNLRRDSVFFPHKIFISKIWHDYFKRETIAAYTSQNVCIMSILKTSKLLYMRFMALALGAVLIAFFGKKTIWNWFNRKNWLFTCSGRPIGSLSILGVYMLI